MQNYKRSKLNELGSLMIEAMAMLALISMVTPILYKKSAERTTELQDINAASEIRSLIKSLDDYVSDHYNDILQGKTVTQNCKTASVNFSDMKETTTASTQKKTINIDHFCEYLPYGFLDKNKEAQSTKTFSKNYKVVFKKVDGGNGRKRVITAFLITEPSDGGTFPKLRASRIASMIGSNGGYLNVSGGTASAMGTQGIWSVDNIATDLGVAANTVKDGAIIASSVQGIASQGGVDNDEVLYRKYRTNRALNTMETDLLMGTSDALGNNITRVNQMIIAAGRPANFAENANDAESALYIKNGGATIKSGIKAADGKFVVDNLGNTTAVSFLAGNFSAQQDLLQLGDGVSGLNATNSGFTLKYNNTGTWDATTGLDSAPINLNSDTKIDGNLHVTKNAYVGKDLRVDGTIDSDKLHARTQLTVGGTPTAPTNLTVTSTSAVFQQPSFIVGGATGITEALSRLFIDANNTTLRSTNAGNLTLEGGVSATLKTANTDGVVTIHSGTGGTVIDSGGSIAIKSAVATGQDAAETPVIINEGMMTFYRNAGKIESIVNSFLVTSSADGAIYGYINPGEKEFSMRDMALYVRDPDDADVFTVDPKTTNQGTARMRGKFSVVNNDTPATESDPLVAGKTVFQVNPDNQQDAATANNATVTVDSNYLKVSNMTDNKRFLTIDIKEGLKDKTVTEKGSVYIRKGVLELETNPAAVTSEQDGTTYSNQGYVKADRFVANHTLDDKALAKPRDFGGFDQGSAGAYNAYQVNPAYTSVMHDIKLTTRGGARLSDILPDFINKGIYIVDNTYKESAVSSWNTSGFNPKPATAYDDCEADAACVASPWMGFVPTPTCPPGYMKVITLTPATFSMAQAGVPGPLPSGPGAKKNVDLIIDYNVRDPNEYVDGYTGTAHYNKSTYVTTAPTPLYFQKNTWLRSMVIPYSKKDGDETDLAAFKGWSAVMGFVYPYNYYQKYITLLELTPTGADASTVIWNLFPVYNQTLEGYATVYCYFNRSETAFGDTLVDKTYDQLGSFRKPNVKSNDDYVKRLNDPTLGYFDPW